MLAGAAPTVETFESIAPRILTSTVEFPALFVDVTGPQANIRHNAAPYAEAAQTTHSLTITEAYVYQKSPGVRLRLKKPAEKLTVRCIGRGWIRAYDGNGVQLAAIEIPVNRPYTEYTFNAIGTRKVASVAITSHAGQNTNYVSIGKVTMTY